jgi:hypothetical protein
MLLVLLFLLHVTTAAETLVCQNRTDYHALLYGLCSRALICHELYGLDAHSERKFDYQISRVQFFAQGGDADARPLIRLLLRGEWQPDLVVAFNASAPPCLNASASFARTALYLLESYKSFVARDFFCPGPGERLLFDEAGVAHCLCPEGRACSSETNFKQILTLLLVLLCVLILLWCMSTIYSVFANRRELTVLAQRGVIL